VTEQALGVVLASGALLVFGGMAAVAATRNLVKVVMGLQAVGLGALLLFAAPGIALGVPPTGAVVLAATAAAAMEAAGIVVVVQVYRKFKTSDPRKVSELKW